MPGPMGPRPGHTTEKAKDFKGTTKKLIKNYLSKYKIGLIIVFIFAVGSTIFSIIGPKILGNATTEIFNGLVNKISGNGGINFGKVGTINTIRTIYSQCIIFFHPKFCNDTNCPKFNI